MQTAQLNIKLDPKLKKQAEKIAKALGLTVSAIVKAFLHEFARTKRVSFSLEEDTDAFLGSGFGGKYLEDEMIKSGYSEKEAKEHGEDYDSLIEDLKTDNVTRWS